MTSTQDWASQLRLDIPAQRLGSKGEPANWAWGGIRNKIAFVPFSFTKKSDSLASLLSRQCLPNAEACLGSTKLLHNYLIASTIFDMFVGSMDVFQKTTWRSCCSVRGRSSKDEACKCNCRLKRPLEDHVALSEEVSPEMRPANAIVNWFWCLWLGYCCTLTCLQTHEVHVVSSRNFLPWRGTQEVFILIWRWDLAFFGYIFDFGPICLKDLILKASNKVHIWLEKPNLWCRLFKGWIWKSVRTPW